MTERRPRWAWLVFPQLAIIVAATVLASKHGLPTAILRRPGADKIGHFLFLGGLSFFAVGFFGRRRWWRTVLALGALSIAEEISQRYFPARTFDLRDIAANLCGVVALGYCARARTPPPASAPSTSSSGASGDLGLARNSRDFGSTTKSISSSGICPMSAVDPAGPTSAEPSDSRPRISSFTPPTQGTSTTRSSA